MSNAAIPVNGTVTATTGNVIMLGQGSLQFQPIWPSLSARTAHVSGDSTRASHCVFCGSGNLVARSDGGIDCQLCNRSFTVMEQPLYSNMPMPDSGPGVKSTPNDPLMQEAPFDAGPQSPVPPAAQAPQPPVAGQPGTQSDPMASVPVALMTRSGVRVNEEDFVLHHALRLARG